MTLYRLIMMAQMNEIDWQAWLADVLARNADQPAQRLELFPWNWQSRTRREAT
jgi:transposase